MLAHSEIRSRATAFADRWKDETSEDAEAKIFWHEFFQVFGVDRKRVAVFEKQVAKAGNKAGFIDLFMPGVCLVEHKSAGRDLDRAFTQAIDYFPGLKDAELPKYVIVSDFQRIRLCDLLAGEDVEITLAQLPERIDLFGFLSGYVARKFKDEDPVNVKAAELMGLLHDALKDSGYKGHELEVFLVRLLFCLFADDTGIFPRNAFYTFLETKTREDGLDVGAQVAFLFQILNTPENKRTSNLDDDFAQFPYVNGALFKEILPMPSFDGKTRERLMECAVFDWQHVSPAVFGAMFQSVMDPGERRNLGAHYTSEQNILKVITGLFLDDLHEEYESAKKNPAKLRKLHDRIAGMRFLDPACGSGNFLIVAYKELRRLEMLILARLEELGALHGSGQQVTDVSALSRLSVQSMCGIEIEEFPARIAEVALWLIDHLMNVELAKQFGGYFVRLPLVGGPTILITDALELDWKSSIIDNDPDCEWFIMGNPPFSGSKMMSYENRNKIQRLFSEARGSGVLDFVTGWFVKAAELIKHTKTRVAFVSTNSISQGEQVGILWDTLFNVYNVKIHFAHRTFRWSNQGRGVAAVHCVIIGFGWKDSDHHWLFDYDTVRSAPVRRSVGLINGYLVAAPMAYIYGREESISSCPPMAIGSKPIDGGNYLFTTEEKEAFIEQEPGSRQLFRPWVGASEYINGKHRWCLYLGDSEPSLIRQLPRVMDRVKAVARFREGSSAGSTRKLAKTPTEFHITNIPEDPFLVVPEVSSEAREYIPIGYLKPPIMPSNKLRVVKSATLFDFAILTSKMHMAWVREVAGRLESRYQYSVTIVYNNFPWPSPSESQKQIVEECAQGVLDARAAHPASNLADLYDPVVMPKDLRKAHEELDKAVDACYGRKSYNTERERVEMLFKMYRELAEKEG
jgi:hypothetical protein